MQIKVDRVEHYGESSQKEQNKDAVKDKSVIIIYDNKGKEVRRELSDKTCMDRTEEEDKWLSTRD